MSLDVIKYSSAVDGLPPIPVASGRYGIIDQCRQQEVVQPGMAMAWKNSTAQADLLSYYKFGNASARPEFGGVVATYAKSPAQDIPISTTNADVTQILFAGEAAIQLAPGETVRKGQYLEPIPSGTYQAMFRVASKGKGVARARQYYNNASGTTAALVSADILMADALGSGLVGAVGPSSAITGTTSATAYSVTVSIPKNSTRVGDRFRIVCCVGTAGSSIGAYAIQGLINGTGSGQFFSNSSTFGGATEVSIAHVDLYVASLSGSNNVSIAGYSAQGVPGTVTMKAVAGQMTMDVTVDNVVTIVATPSNNADSTTLRFLSVEKL
jgi:hypothetical protein